MASQISDVSQSPGAKVVKSETASSAGSTYQKSTTYDEINVAEVVAADVGTGNATASLTALSGLVNPDPRTPDPGKVSGGPDTGAQTMPSDVDISDQHPQATVPAGSVQTAPAVLTAGSSPTIDLTQAAVVTEQVSPVVTNVQDGAVRADIDILPAKNLLVPQGRDVPSDAAEPVIVNAAPAQTEQTETPDPEPILSIASAPIEVAPPVFDANVLPGQPQIISSDDVAENAEGGTVVLTLLAVDDDGDAVDFAITDADGIPVQNDHFEIIGDQIRVKAGAGLDYETQDRHQFFVTASDGAGNSAPHQVTINVTDHADIVHLADTGGAFTDTGVTELEVIGGASADTIIGSQIADRIFGGAGGDTITTGAGDDRTVAGEGADVVTGEDGADTILGEAGADRLFGGTGDDALFGGDGADVVFGGDGHDALTGGAGADRIDGGTGNDVIAGNAGDDIIYAGAGDDTFDDTGIGNGNDIVDMAAGDDTAFTGDGNDTLSGGAGNDALLGEAGNDVITGGAGDDKIYGGTGDDVAVFSGNRADYTITESGGIFTLTDQRDMGSDGTDQVRQVETFRFADGDIAAVDAPDTVSGVAGAWSNADQWSSSMVADTGQTGDALMSWTDMIDGAGSGANSDAGPLMESDHWMAMIDHGAGPETQGPDPWDALGSDVDAHPFDAAAFDIPQIDPFTG